MNSLDDLTPDCLGYAGLVYEHVLVRSSLSALHGGGGGVALFRGVYENVWLIAHCLLIS